MAVIEKYSIPRFLYRYRSLGTRNPPAVGKVNEEISAIRNGHLWCGTYGRLNDPMEGLYHAGSQLRRGDGWDAARDEIRYGKSQIGIASFSEVKNHPLMWAHYASSFRGICVEYDFERILRSLGGNLSFVRVQYAEQLPELISLDDNPNELSKRILSTKNHHWAYEREWRLFSPNAGLQSYWDPLAVSRVYLGPRMEPNVVEKFMNLRGSHGLEVERTQVEGYAMTTLAVT